MAKLGWYYDNKSYIQILLHIAHGHVFGGWSTGLRDATEGTPGSFHVAVHIHVVTANLCGTAHLSHRRCIHVVLSLKGQHCHQCAVGDYLP